jgi:hypothetical protein
VFENSVLRRTFGLMRPVEKHRRRWEDNTQMDFREIEWGRRHWIDLAEVRDHWRAVVNTVINLRVL